MKTQVWIEIINSLFAIVDHFDKTAPFNIQQLPKLIHVNVFFDDKLFYIQYVQSCARAFSMRPAKHGGMKCLVRCKPHRFD